MQIIIGEFISTSPFIRQSHVNSDWQALSHLLHRKHRNEHIIHAQINKQIFFLILINFFLIFYFNFEKWYFSSKIFFFHIFLSFYFFFLNKIAQDDKAINKSLSDEDILLSTDYKIKVQMMIGEFISTSPFIRQSHVNSDSQALSHLLRYHRNEHIIHARINKQIFFLILINFL